MGERPKGPGLKFRSRKHGVPVPYWIASEAAVKAGYQPRAVRLTGYGSDAEIIARCHRLQAEMLLWLSGQRSAAPQVRRFLSVAVSALPSRPGKPIPASQAVIATPL